MEDDGGTERGGEELEEDHSPSASQSRPTTAGAAVTPSRYTRSSTRTPSQIGRTRGRALRVVRRTHRSHFGKRGSATVLTEPMRLVVRSRRNSYGAPRKTVVA